MEIGEQYMNVLEARDLSDANHKLVQSAPLSPEPLHFRCPEERIDKSTATGIQSLLCPTLQVSSYSYGELMAGI